MVVKLGTVEDFQDIHTWGVLCRQVPVSGSTYFPVELVKGFDSWGEYYRDNNSGPKVYISCFDWRHEPKHLCKAEPGSSLGSFHQFDGRGNVRVGDADVAFVDTGKTLLVDCAFPARNEIVSNIIW